MNSEIFETNFGNFLKGWSKEFAFILSFGGTSGSLYVSNILNWHVCGICWAQRIFMYPIPLVLAYSILFENEKIALKVIPLSILGATFSLYHYLSIVIDPTRACGFFLPCSMGDPLYIGILLRPRYLPFLGFLSFLAISVLVWRDD